MEDHTTELHEERIETVASLLIANGGRTILDLGCGEGLLISRLAQENQFHRILGIDTCRNSLSKAQARISTGLTDGKRNVELRYGSITTKDPSLQGFDAAVMVEAIEHIKPRDLSKVESYVFQLYRPRFIVLTTPNRDYNQVIGLEENSLRRSDHHFEWSRSRFTKWAVGVAQRSGYLVRFSGIGTPVEPFGQPTQMVVFTINP